MVNAPIDFRSQLDGQATQNGEKEASGINADTSIEPGEQFKQTAVRPHASRVLRAPPMLVTVP